MHYYLFHISDYKSHTEHLELMEDLAYRRMLDWCYLHEKPLPKSKDEIARMIRMRTHSDCIATVLREFFTKTKDGEYIHKRVFLEINKASEKSSKARDSAKARWDKVSSDANALQTDCDSNATQDPLPKTHNPLPKKKGTNKFVQPSVLEIQEYCQEKNYQIDPESFIAFYESNGWKVGKNPMKSWKGALTTWSKRSEVKHGQNQQDNRSRTQRVSDELDRLAQEAINRGETI